jgi:hypothetical protein
MLQAAEQPVVVEQKVNSLVLEKDADLALKEVKHRSFVVSQNWEDS